MHTHARATDAVFRRRRALSFSCAAAAVAMGNSASSSSSARGSRSLPCSPEAQRSLPVAIGALFFLLVGARGVAGIAGVFSGCRSSTGSHKAVSSIPLPGSALPARKCAPDKVSGWCVLSKTILS